MTLKGNGDVRLGWKGAGTLWRGNEMKHSINPETCSLCDQPALTRVKDTGFCKAHRAEADAATSALKGRSELSGSIRRITRGSTRS